jgi:hypothetical protein
MPAYSNTPKRCVSCGCLVELVPPDAFAYDSPFGCHPLYVDNRVPPHLRLILPPTCWMCRGAVILSLPEEIARPTWRQN